MAASSNRPGVPISTSWFSRAACNPCPGSAVAYIGLAFRERRRCRAAASTARASTCSDPCSASAATRNTSSASSPGTIRISVSSGWPSVRVPVLSSSMTWALCSCSRLVPSRKRMPLRAPRPVPTIMAVGVARPSARAGHHEYGDSGDQRHQPGVRGRRRIRVQQTQTHDQEPADERAAGNQQNAGNKDAGDGIRQSLDGRFAALRPFDQANDFGKRRILPHPGRT